MLKILGRRPMWSTSINVALSLLVQWNQVDFYSISSAAMQVSILLNTQHISSGDIETWMPDPNTDDEKSKGKQREPWPIEKQENCHEHKQRVRTKSLTWKIAYSAH